VTSNGFRQIVGTIDDWDLQYETKGRSIATAKASDGLTQLANQTLTGGTQSLDLSGVRIDKILSDPEVNWPIAFRNLDSGQTVLQPDVIESGTNALGYIQKITTTEPGGFFISKNGNARFRDRYSTAATNGVTFSDNGTGISYTNLRVIYGTELLYNEIVTTRLNGGTATANDTNSQEQYGIFNLTIDGLLMNDDQTAENLTNLLLSKYSQPEYRFEELTVNLEAISEVQNGWTLGDADKGRLDFNPGLAKSESDLNQNKVLALELGDAVQVRFTPSSIGDPIERAVEIIRIAQSVNPTNHQITFGLGALEGAFWKLGDPVFGRLSRGNALAY
jgi:hypothetical protein